MTMQKKYFIIFLSIIFLSCRKDIIIENTPKNVFLTFWKIMDENYVYFEEKNLNWDSVYSAYYPQAQAAKTDRDLFNIFSEIIPLFKDGHVNIKGTLNNSTFSISAPYSNDTLWSFGVYRPETEYITIEDLGFEYKVGSIDFSYKNFYGYQHKTKNYALILTYSMGDIGWVNTTSEELTESLKCLNYKDGLIFSIIDNGGGWSDEMYNIAAMFFSEKRVVDYSIFKAGKGHNDFGEKVFTEVQGKGIIPCSIPVILLTGPATYSAGNTFAYIINDLPNCISVGKRTGGGGGGRLSVMLPNGWTLYYPYRKLFSINSKNMEYGLMPDIYVKVEIDKKDDTSVGDVMLKAIEVLDSIKCF